jgi:hypothetical protein
MSGVIAVPMRPAVGGGGGCAGCGLGDATENGVGFCCVESGGFWWAASVSTSGAIGGESLEGSEELGNLGALGGNGGGLAGSDACGGGGVVHMVCRGSLIGVVVSTGACGGVDAVILVKGEMGLEASEGAGGFVVVAPFAAANIEEARIGEIGVANSEDGVGSHGFAAGGCEFHAILELLV